MHDAPVHRSVDGRIQLENRERPAVLADDAA